VLAQRRISLSYDLMAAHGLSNLLLPIAGEWPQTPTHAFGGVASMAASIHGELHPDQIPEE
jgi:hypothetical protein